MSLYNMIVFIHILGAIGIFVTLSVERLALFRLQRADSIEKSRTWWSVMRLLPRIGIPSILTLLASGIYLTIESWSEAPWILPSFGALVLIAFTGIALSRPTFGKLEAFYKSNAELQMPPKHSRLWGRLWGSLQIRTGLALGILFIMVTKPNLFTSLVILCASLFLMLIPILFFALKYRDAKSVCA